MLLAMTVIAYAFSSLSRECKNRGRSRHSPKNTVELSPTSLAPLLEFNPLYIVVCIGLDEDVENQWCYLLLEQEQESKKDI